MIEWIIGIAGIATLFLLLWLFYHKDNTLDKGEVRRSIAISITVVFIITLAYSISSDNVGEHFLSLLKWAFSIVMAFYFGSRVVERVAEILKS